MKSLIKILSFKVCFLALFIFSGVFVSVAFADSDSVMMYGKTTPILTNGINNAGNIWFQNDGAVVYLPDAADQQPHLVLDPSNPGGYLMEGWAWSDNLGWVSFYCKSGTNNGAACGAFDYGVTIDPSGVFHGYAWNSAMGYINVNSETYNPPALDGSGRPIVHALKMNTKNGAITGYAWSPSLGWLNFNGVYARVKIKISANINTPEKCPSANPTGLCGCFGSSDPSSDPSKLNPTLDAGLPGAVKVADGVDNYQLDLYFKDENGAAITADKFGKDKPYEAKVLLNWKDTVRRNQTDVNFAVASYDKVSKPFQNSTGAVIYKPVLLYTTPFVSTLGSVSDNEGGADTEVLPSTIFNISSVAPTSKANVSKIEGKTGTVSNDDLSLVPGFAGADEFKAKPNYLQLDSIEWIIENKTTGRIIEGVSHFDKEHGTLEFKPALEVSKMNSTLSANDTNVKNTLWMFRNVPVGVDVGGKSNRKGKVIDETKTTTTVDFVMSLGGDGKFNTGFTNSTVVDAMNTNIKAGNTGTVPNSSDIGMWFSTLLTLTEPLDLEASLAKTEGKPLPGNYFEGAGVYSKISYEATTPGKKDVVSYFSNHLPRVASTAISNPVVVIQGTTYSQGNEVSSPQLGVNITGIGDQNINIVRDLVFENIQKLLMDKTVPTHVNGKVDLPDLNPASCTSDKGCLPIELDKEIIFYFAADNVVIKGAGDIHVFGDKPKNTVVVVSGGDIHVESNLYTDNADKKKYKIGLVALRENDLGEGNIYIGPEVTDIQALMIADGTLFSAPDFGFTTNSFGEPNDLDKPVDPSTFNKQLLIEGGVSSRNCIGCVDSNAFSYFLPTRGSLSKDGETDGVPNKDVAKRYDLNYLRYYSLQLEYDDFGNPIDQQCPQACNGIDPTLPVSQGGDLVLDDTLRAKGLKDKPNQTNAVYIKYVPPSADSFVFSKSKSLTF